mmetsp:Transcript_5061/g.21923  ORF Transcript_5061/g.21923 Transcript_5061/m.21923 type:complete len:1209 (+) Transcript_5061:252-3878(+)
MEDLFDLSEEDRAEFQAARFEEEWAKEVQKGQSASLVRAVSRAHGGLFLRAAPLKAIYDFLHFVGPFALHGLLQTIATGGGLRYAVLLFCSSFLQTILLQQYFMMCFRSGTHIRSGVMSAVFKKALRVSTGTRNKESVGQMMNLLSNDVNRIGPRLTPYAHMLWSGPLQIVTAFIILWKLIGVGAVSGLLITAIVIPLNLAIMKKRNVAQRNLMQKKDERVRAVNEVMSSIRQVKFFAWEPELTENVTAARETELVSLKTSTFLGNMGSVLWNAAPLAVSASAFAAMAFATDIPITPERVFVALALFNILRFPLNMFPSLINNSIEATVSSKRLREFLLSPEAPGRRQDTSESCAAGFNGADYGWKELESNPEASETTPLTSTSSNPAILKSLQIKIAPGSLTTIVGAVGSGKSSFLSALLGEMHCLTPDGEREFLNGRVSYAAQTPWLMNATVKENILFGEPFNQARYNSVLSACCLESDLDVLPAGDATEIGEKGIILSGGQKSRVALARCLYREADVYLLDDPLSAVDAHVGKHLFEKAINGPLLADKTRLLVTHHVQYLEKVDRVIVVSNGTVSADGSFWELKNQGFSFHFLKAAEDEQEEEPEQDAPEDSKTIDGPKVQQQLQNGTMKTGGGETEKGKLMTTEERVVGKVKMKIYMDYFRALGMELVITYALLAVAAMCAQVAVDGWLTRWTNAAIQEGAQADNYYYIEVYTVLAIVASALLFARSILVVYSVVKAGRRLHSKMLRSVMRSPISFFDSTPLGRIVNRFAKDQTSVDEELPDAVTSFLLCVVRVVANVSVIMFVTWRIVFIIIPLGWFYNMIGNRYIRTCRELRRLDANTKAPILAFFGETLVGVDTVRAFDTGDRFMIENQKRIDENTKPMLWNIVSNRWLSVRLETVGTVLVSSAALLAVLGGRYISASLAGLSISYALQITQTLSWLIRMGTETETQMNSIERVLHYSNLPSEAPEHLPGDPAEDEWPTKGEVEFRGVELKYRSDLPPALKGISFIVLSGENVGVVGRTGAGKTSLAQALFRMVEMSQGQIFVDGKDISTLGLHTLRSRLAIITQDPMLVSATVRHNLDPFKQHSDAKIWECLDLVSMRDCISRLADGLDSEVHDQGQNFSVGQRQLLCLGRALLRNAKLMILDEATASIDHETDTKVQQAIRNFKNDCTLITIAHRLQTVMDSDAVSPSVNMQLTAWLNV